MRVSRTLGALVCCSACVLALAPHAAAQTAPLRSHPVPVHIDSGWVENSEPGLAVVYSTVLQVPDATWLRLAFDDVQLAGRIANGTASYLRLTSLYDGNYQQLNAVHVRQWRHTSAYLNGDLVLIELLAHPGTGPNRLLLTTVTAGEPGYDGDRSICGPTDDRELSDDPRAGRLQPGGCTAWIIDDCNHCFYTAGHCTDSNTVVEFNVPLSNANGSLNHPPPEDQYAVDPDSVQSNGGQGTGNDWGYFGCYPNSNTGLTAFEAQGSYFTVVMPPPVGSNNIRITGYGTVSSPVSLTWNQVQKTHVGPLVTSSGTLVQYRTDTTGGNSGSPVIWEENGNAIGIHTHGGCNSTGGQNSGTGANHPGLLAARANPTGVCACVTGLQVVPETDFDSSGDPGGPFAPPSMDYTLRNIGTTSLDYEVTWFQPWLSVTNASGELEGGEQVIVTAALNANANTLPLGVYNDVLLFTNLTTHQGDAARNVILHVGGAEALYAWNLDTNPGWNISGGQWAFGHPTGAGGSTHGYPDPNNGATGINVYGVNLNGDYSTTPAGPYYVQLGPVDLSATVADVSLRFKRWLNSDYQPYAYATIEASVNGSYWINVWSNGTDEIAESAWSAQQVDLSAVAIGVETCYIRWGYQVASGAWAYSGWNLDDVEIWGVATPPPNPGDLDCDGDVDFDDINPFVLALSDPAAYQAQFPGCLWLNGDCDGDGDVDFDDINVFVALLAP